MVSTESKLLNIPLIRGENRTRGFLVVVKNKYIAIALKAIVSARINIKTIVKLMSINEFAINL